MPCSCGQPAHDPWKAGQDGVDRHHAQLERGRLQPTQVGLDDPGQLGSRALSSPARSSSGADVASSQLGGDDAQISPIRVSEAVDHVAAHAQDGRIARVGVLPCALPARGAAVRCGRAGGSRLLVLLGVEKQLVADVTQRLHALALRIERQQRLAHRFGRMLRQDQEIEPALAVGQRRAVTDDLGLGGEPGHDRLADRGLLLEKKHQLVDICAGRHTSREIADILRRQAAHHVPVGP